MQDYITDYSGTALELETNFKEFALEPSWVVRCIFAERPHCFLSEAMHNLIAAQSQCSTSLADLANGSQNLLSAVGTITRSLEDIPTPEELDFILNKLFHPDTTEDVKLPEKPTIQPEEIKAAPFTSLLSQLSVFFLKFKNLRGSL
jgi:hypothetical protein